MSTDERIVLEIQYQAVMNYKEIIGSYEQVIHQSLNWNLSLCNPLYVFPLSSLYVILCLGYKLYIICNILISIIIHNLD